jgi:hypothetical protein
MTATGHWWNLWFQSHWFPILAGMESIHVSGVAYTEAINRFWCWILRWIWSVLTSRIKHLAWNERAIKPMNWIERY